MATCLSPCGPSTLPCASRTWEKVALRSPRARPAHLPARGRLLDREPPRWDALPDKRGVRQTLP
eukprot:12694499-Alexandrium_andersonii.AAC.1